MKAFFVNKYNNYYEIDEGSVLIKNFNEELDSMTIRISHLTEENRLNNLEPFDIVRIVDDQDRFGTFYMCIGDCQERMINCTDGEKIYNYSISLFSQTKELEGIILPSLSITRNASDPKTIWHYLQQYNSLFGTKIRINNPTGTVVQSQTKQLNIMSYGSEQSISGNTNVYLTGQGIKISSYIDLTIPSGCTYRYFNETINGATGGDFEYDETNDVWIGEEYDNNGTTEQTKITVTKLGSNQYRFFYEGGLIDAATFRFEITAYYISNTNQITGSVSFNFGKEIQSYETPVFNVVEGNVSGSSYTVSANNDSLVVNYSATAHGSAIPVIEVTVSATLLGDFNWTNKYIFGHEIYSNQSVQDKFNVECPEMQWNNPTFRDVLNDLFMVRDCIPVVRNNIIDFIDISKTHNEVDDAYVNFVERNKSSADYVSEIKMTMKNVLQNKKDNIQNYTKVIEWIPLSGGNDFVTTSSATIMTQKPIYNVVDFEAYIIRHNPSTSHLNFDIKDPIFVKEQLLEEGLYNLKYHYPKSYFNGNFKIEANNAEYRELCLYYSRGSNEIKGLTNSIRALVSNVSNIQTFNLLSFAIGNYTPDETYRILRETGSHGYPTNAYFTILFKIEYETLADFVFSASKDELPNNKKVIIDNQTNSYVDAYAQGFLEYQKANRLGNEIVVINAFYRNDDEYSSLIDIGDYYEGRNVVYQTQYEIFNDHINVQAYATKDFILRNYFTGIKSKIRSWKIAEDSDALTRSDLEKYYLEFSFDKYVDNGILPNPIYFLSPLFINEINPIKYIFVQSFIEDENQEWVSIPSDNRYYSLETSFRLVGNSIVCSFCANNNTNFGSYIFNSDEIGLEGVDMTPGTAGDFLRKAPYVKGTTNKGGVLTKPFSYTNDYGECLEFNFEFSSEYRNNADTLIQYIIDHGDIGSYYTNDYIREAYYKAICRPIIFAEDILDYGEHPIGTGFTHTWNKDNKEIADLSIQFEFCRDTYNIAFTKEFIERQQMIRTVTNDISLRVYVGNSSDYDFRNPSLGSAELDSDAAVRRSENRVYIINVTEDPTKCYYITDGNDVLLLALNGKTSCYLNVLADRNKNIYESQANQEIVGDIKVSF